MYILGLVVVIGLLIWAYIDYKKIDTELRRCPKCDTIIKQTFNLDYKNRYVSKPNENGENLQVKIYKCQNCGNSWNNTYEYNETSN